MLLALAAHFREPQRRTARVAIGATELFAATLLCGRALSLSLTVSIAAGWLITLSYLAALRNAKNRDIVDVYAYHAEVLSVSVIVTTATLCIGARPIWRSDPVSGHSLFGYHAHCARQSNQPGPRCARDCNCSQRFYPAQFQPSRTAHHPRMLGGSGRGLFRSWILSLYWRLARLYRHEFLSGGLEATSNTIPRRDYIATLDTAVRVYDDGYCLPLSACLLAAVLLVPSPCYCAGHQGSASWPSACS